MKKIEAVIFDLDGTLLDTERLNAIAVQGMVKEMGYNSSDIIEWYYENCIGLGSARVFEKLKKHVKFSKTSEEVVKEFRKYRANFFTSTIIPIKDGLHEIIEFLKECKIKMAIYTGSALDQIYIKMNQANVSIDCFEVLVGVDMVKNPKPHPEGYIITCEKLGIKPQNALVVEDSDIGAIAAIAAGAKVVIVPDIKENNPEVKAQTLGVVKSLRDVISIIKRENKEKKWEV